MRLRLLEELTNAGRTDADEHLDELRTGDIEEGNVRFAGDGSREQRLPGSRRPDEQDALGDPAPEALVLPGAREEVDDLPQLGHRLVDAGDVREVRPHLLPVVDAGLRPSEGE